MRNASGAIVVLCAGLIAASAQGAPAKPAKGKPGAQPAGKCELLLPAHRTDDTRVAQERVAPTVGVSPTGNTYFLMPRPYKRLIVHLKPATSDTGTYLVKLITRYTDDTIYEPIVEAIVPAAGVERTWGPIEVTPRFVPKDKIADMFNVKVQDNYTMTPDAKGFSYSVWVEGCD